MQVREKVGEKQCFFCLNGLPEVDFTDGKLLRRFMSTYMKIAPRRRSGLCAKHQRKVASAIKRARVLGLVPYTPLQGK